MTVVWCPEPSSVLQKEINRRMVMCLSVVPPIPPPPSPLPPPPSICFSQLWQGTTNKAILIITEVRVPKVTAAVCLSVFCFTLLSWILTSQLLKKCHNQENGIIVTWLVKQFKLVLEKPQSILESWVNSYDAYSHWPVDSSATNSTPNVYCAET